MDAHGLTREEIDKKLEESQGIERLIWNQKYPEVAEYFKHEEIMDILKDNPKFDSFFITSLNEDYEEIKEPIKYAFYSKINAKEDILEVGLVLINREGDKWYMSPEVIESYVGTFLKNQDGTDKLDENGNAIRFINVEEAKVGLWKAFAREAKRIDRYLDKDYRSKVLFGGFEDDQRQEPNRKDNDKISVDELVDLMSSLCSNDISDFGMNNSR